MCVGGGGGGLVWGDGNAREFRTFWGMKIVFLKISSPGCSLVACEPDNFLGGQERENIRGEMRGRAGGGLQDISL